MRFASVLCLAFLLSGCLAKRTYWVRQADRPAATGCHQQCRAQHGDSDEFYECFSSCPNVETTFSAECKGDVPGICYERTELDGRPALVLGLAGVTLGLLAFAVASQMKFEGLGQRGGDTPNND